MLLMDPTEAAMTVGARCGPAVAGDSSGIREALRWITPAVEALLEVQTLSATRTTDVFHCIDSHQRGYFLSLSNAFVVPSTVVVTTYPGEVVWTPDTDYTVSGILGIVRPVYALALAQHTVEYVSGFSVAYPEETDEPLTEEQEAYLVAQGVPDWIKGIVVTLLVEWFRSKPLAPKVPDSIRMNDLMRALRSDLSRRMGGHYYRTRYGVLFPDAP